VSIALFDQVQNLDLAGANRTALGLLGLAFAVLAGTAWLRTRERSWS
jgi:ABC-type molybdate transport system permease subunit